jgi:pSer/pThr/pTyr-binding forkhead associated (FHA) protein
MNPGFRLVMRAGPSAGKIYLLDKSELFVGRDLNNDVVINDPEVSRRHVRLFLQGTNFVIEDLGSTNGTQINGQRIMGPHILRPGEMVIFGEHVSLVFEAVEPEIDATLASSGPRIAPTTQPQYEAPQPPAYQAPQPVYQPPQPVYNVPQPAYTPPVQPFAGQVPTSPDYAEPEEKKKFPVWIIVAILVLLVVICACAAFLWFVDSNNLWCNWFGFVFGPDACP